MTEDSEAPKLHVDADWKAEAEAEKLRMVQQQEAQEAEAAEGDGGDLPAANFETLVSTLATQALMAMGAIADPMSGQRFLHLDLARHHIDMLNILHEKSKGNLSEEEDKLLAGTLYELRQRYIETVKAQREANR